MGKILETYKKELQFLDQLNSSKKERQLEVKKAVKIIRRFTPVGNQFVYAASFPDLKYIYFSPSVKSVLGFDPSYFNSPDDFCELIHPDDLPVILNATFKSLSLGSDLKNIKEFENVFHMDFRMRKSNGEYIRVQRQTGLLTKTKQGKLASTFGIVSDISHIKKSDEIILKMTGPEIPGYSFHSGNTNTKKIFSKQEIKIIDKIIAGKTSKEIATIFNISIETVFTHRKNILRKSGKKSSTDLVAWVLKNGY